MLRRDMIGLCAVTGATWGAMIAAMIWSGAFPVITLATLSAALGGMIAYLFYKA